MHVLVFFFGTVVYRGYGDASVVPLQLIFLSSLSCSFWPWRFPSNGEESTELAGAVLYNAQRQAEPPRTAPHQILGCAWCLAGAKKVGFQVCCWIPVWRIESKVWDIGT